MYAVKIAGVMAESQGLFLHNALNLRNLQKFTSYVKTIFSIMRK